jgi:predicted DCC family thiol-disulfide oxidoreductase YuxK
MAELTVLYDEGCGFCTRVARWVAHPPRVEIAPVGSPAGELLLRDLTQEERYATMHVVDATGRRRSGSSALAPLARTIPGGTALAIVLDAFPGPTRAAYDLVARNRGLASMLLRAYDKVAASAAATRSARSA